MQCLHHAITTDVKDVLFVAASSSGILYVMRITFEDDVLLAYKNYLKSVTSFAFGWVGKPALQIPDEVVMNVCENDDGTKEEAFFSFYNLCMNLTRYCLSTSKPLPHTLQIRPRLALAWNAVKGGTDEYSRVLSTCRVDINGSHPFVKYTFRFILTQLYNSFLAYRLFHSSKDILQKKESVSNVMKKENGYWLQRKRNTKFISFKRFLRRFVDDVLRLEPESSDMECKQLPLRFATLVLSSFSTPDMWKLRTSGTHRIIQQPYSARRMGKDGRIISTRTRKWCVICSKVQKFDVSKKIRKSGFKTTYCCERCQVPLCSPVGRSKRLCWELFHSTRDLSSDKAVLNRLAQLESTANFTVDEAEPVANLMNVSSNSTAEQTNETDDSRGELACNNSNEIETAITARVRSTTRRTTPRQKTSARKRSRSQRRT